METGIDHSKLGPAVTPIANWIWFPRCCKLISTSVVEYLFGKCIFLRFHTQTTPETLSFHLAGAVIHFTDPPETRAALQLGAAVPSAGHPAGLLL